MLYECGNGYVVGDFSPVAGNASSYRFVPRPSSAAARPRFDGTIDGESTMLSGASKGFYDESTSRYLHWTWIWELYREVNATAPASTYSKWGWDSVSSVTREVTFDPETELLVFYPVEELETLRGPAIFQRTGVRVPTMSPVDRLPPPGSLPPSAAAAATDIEVTLRWPGWGADRPPPGQLVLSVLAAADGSEYTNVVYDTARREGSWGEWMPHTDLPCDPEPPGQPGCDLNCTTWPVAPAGNDTNARGCEAVCVGNPACVGWVLVSRESPTADLCCQKRRIDRRVDSPTVTAGVKPGELSNHTIAALLLDRRASRRPGAVPLAGGKAAEPTSYNSTVSTPVPVKPGDGGGITLRVLVDRSVLEAYAGRGRAHFTGRSYPSAPATSTGIRVGWRPAPGAPAAAVADVAIWPMQQGLFPVHPNY